MTARTLSLGAIRSVGELLCLFPLSPLGGNARLLVLGALSLRRLTSLLLHQPRALFNGAALGFGRPALGHILCEDLCLSPHLRIPLALLGFELGARRFLGVARLTLAPGLLEKPRRFLLAARLGSLSGGNGRSARSFGALALVGSIGVGPACRLFLATRSLSPLLVIGAARLLGGELFLRLLQSLPTRFLVPLANDLALGLCGLLRFSNLL